MNTKKKPGQLKRTAWELLRISKVAPPQYASRLRAMAFEMQVQIDLLKRTEIPCREIPSPCSSQPQDFGKSVGLRTAISESTRSGMTAKLHIGTLIGFPRLPLDD